jgi:hypothetical protein
MFESWVRGDLSHLQSPPVDSVSMPGTGTITAGVSESPTRPQGQEMSEERSVKSRLTTAADALTTFHSGESEKRFGIIHSGMPNGQQRLEKSRRWLLISVRSIVSG